MDFPFAALVLCALLARADALTCYNCPRSDCDRTKESEPCKEGELCKTELGRHFSDNVPLESIKKSCEASKNCTNISLNLGSIVRDISCCSKDLCNTGPVKEKPSNELQCFGCVQMLSDFNCIRTGPINCTDTQTKCGRLQAKSERNTVDFQGCVSESVCRLNSTAIIFGVALGTSFECCGSNLCNGGSRIGTGALCLVTLGLYLLAAINK